ncbi:reticulon-like protein B8 [Tasmannia lanceolata]|uniref:reticulon-like protein B8 n=1 Tax=Tasmannia lanceolata TaxID=3420 RepID=UPI004064AE35
MPERMAYTAENLLNNVMETIAENVPMQKIAENVPMKKSAPFREEEKPVSGQTNKLFGRQKTLHNVLGGGKSADVLLWRNKKISSSVLLGATAVWVLFEWLNYNFMTLVSFALVLGMLMQFILSNASGLLNRSPSQVPRLVLPDELFVNIAVNVGAEVNRFLLFLQDVATGGNLKQFLATVASLWVAAIIGTWCNFLSVLYIGFVAAHTLPVLYERYEEQVDNFFYNLLGQLQQQYQRMDSGILRKMPSFRGRKYE